MKRMYKSQMCFLRSYYLELEGNQCIILVYLFTCLEDIQGPAPSANGPAHTKKKKRINNHSK